jgi:serine/threonine protein kinase
MSKGGLLPLRWMAPESMQRMEFTTKSDVSVFLVALPHAKPTIVFRWSYAVLLYELFSFGDTPYISMQKSEILDFLRSGKRLPQPQVATEKMLAFQFCYDL